MLELAAELGNSNLVQLLLETAATVTSEESLVPPLMIAVLHRHRDNTQLLLNARADPWQAVPLCAICDHPWYWCGLLSRRESVNAVQVAVAQGPTDTVIELTHSKGRLYGSLESRVAIEPTAQSHCHDRTCHPHLE